MPEKTVTSKSSLGVVCSVLDGEVQGHYGIAAVLSIKILDIFPVIIVSYPIPFILLAGGFVNIY